MLIISDYKDYYDTAIGYGGIDKSIVYKRKEIEINHEFGIYTEKYNKYFKFLLDTYTNKDSSFRYFYRYDYHNLFNLEFILLLVCGNIYPVINLHVTFAYAIKKRDYYFYNFEEFKEFIDKKFRKRMKKVKYRNNKQFFKDTEIFFHKLDHINQLSLINYHMDVDSPIVYYNMDDNKIILNAKLSNYDFYKVIDAFQMYQKLEMFLSGVMISPEKEIVQLDDISLRDKKGFNDMSFKKEKEK